MSFLTGRGIANTRAASYVVCHDLPRNRRPFDGLIRLLEAVARGELPRAAARLPESATRAHARAVSKAAVVTVAARGRETWRG